MKVRFVPSPGALITLTLKDGSTFANEDVAAIEIEPFFGMASGQGDVVDGEAVSDSRGVVDRFSISAAGATGKISRRERLARDQPVKPAIDRPLVPRIRLPKDPAKEIVP